MPVRSALSRRIRLSTALIGGLLLAGAAVRPLPAQELPAPAVPASGIERTIDSLHAAGDDGALGRAYRQLAEALEKTGNDDRVIDAYRLSIRHALLGRDSATMAVGHNGLGLAHWSASRYDSALANLSRSRRIREAIGDRRGLGLVLNSIGASYYQLGQYEPALDAFVQALAIRREEGDDRSVAVILTNIGKSYHDFRQYDRAREVLEEAVAAARAVGEPVVIGYALHTLGVLHLDLGDHTPARALFEQSIAAYTGPRVTPLDSAAGWSLNAIALGRLNVREGRIEAAVVLLDAVLENAERRQSVRGQARALLYLGEAHRAAGRYRDARATLERSVALSRSVEQRVLALEAAEMLADLEEETGNTGAALRHLRTVQALRDTIFDQATAQRIAAMEARAATEREQRENARLRAEQQEQSLVIARHRVIAALGTITLFLAGAVLGLLWHFNRKGRAREALLARTNAELGTANAELRTALSEVRTLTGLIPICARCKKVRDDEGFWEAVETYITSRSEATFSHGICASCGPELYGEHWHDCAHEDGDEDATGQRAA